ncbi:MAG TPA: DUF1559 domain-containing protein [Pirellulales bacterium]|nr:DUF1559 domain-containing protein [Pirellulales bacterium]
MRRTIRPGLTIVELVVVVAVIGLLLALTLAAVNAARESARRVQCTANLAQFGRALAAYESSRRAFPPAMRNLDAPKKGSLWYAPHVRLLPFLEQSAAAAVIDLQQSPGFYAGPPGLPFMRLKQPMLPWTPLPVFRCPSDRDLSVSPSGNSYRVCTGPGTSQYPSNLTVDGGLGAFIALQPLTPGEIRDGLSATIGVSEKRIGSGRTSFSRRVDFWYSGSSALGPATPDQMAAYCNALSGPPPVYFTYSGDTWFTAGYENSWYNHVLTPNAETPDCSMDMMAPGQSPTGGGAFRASSYHPGGVNSMNMDGSVRFVADGVDLAVWRAASTRAGGEAVAMPPD